MMSNKTVLLPESELNSRERLVTRMEVCWLREGVYISLSFLFFFAALWAGFLLSCRDGFFSIVIHLPELCLDSFLWMWLLSVFCSVIPGAMWLELFSCN